MTTANHLSVSNSLRPLLSHQLTSRPFTASINLLFALPLLPASSNLRILPLTSTVPPSQRELLHFDLCHLHFCLLSFPIVPFPHFLSLRAVGLDPGSICIMLCLWTAWGGLSIGATATWRTCKLHTEAQIQTHKMRNERFYIILLLKCSFNKCIYLDSDINNQ